MSKKPEESEVTETPEETPVETKAPAVTEEKPKAKKKSINLRNTLGEEVKEKDYFYAPKGGDTAPEYFNRECGQPVSREDILEVFHKIFKPSDNFLFYKVDDKELYVVIVPIKHAHTIGPDTDSIEGDFQKHALSFIQEGGMNLDTLRSKLLRVKSTIKMAD